MIFIIFCDSGPYFTILSISLELKSFDKPLAVLNVYLAMQARSIILLRINVDIILASDCMLVFAVLVDSEQVKLMVISVFDFEYQNLYFALLLFRRVIYVL